MKTVIMFLCAVLIGFGYLLSINISTQEEIARLQQQVRQLESDKRTLQAQLDASLAQLAQTQQATNELTRQNQDQAETISQLKQRMADQQEQIMALQAQVILTKTGSTIRGSLSNALKAGMFLPLIPAALATTYLVVRSHQHAPRKTSKTTGPRSTWVQLTDREIARLIHMRRKQVR